jgi:hypothetical protein
MKRTVVSFLLAPLWMPAAYVAYAAYKMPFLKSRHLVIGAIISAIFAYGGSLILGLAAFHALGFFGVRNRKSFWIARPLASPILPRRGTVRRREPHHSIRPVGECRRRRDHFGAYRRPASKAGALAQIFPRPCRQTLLSGV